VALAVTSLRHAFTQAGAMRHVPLIRRGQTP